MADLNLGHLISKFVNYRAINSQTQSHAKSVAQNSFTASASSQASQSIQTSYSAPQMGSMAAVDPLFKYFF